MHVLSSPFSSTLVSTSSITTTASSLLHRGATHRQSSLSLDVGNDAAAGRMKVTGALPSSVSSTALVARVGLVLVALMAILASAPSTQAQKSQQQSDLFRRIQNSPKGYIDVDSNEFTSIVQLPRNYAVTALLTTTDGGIKCVPCLAFQPEFDSLAAQWNKNKAVKSKNIFVKVEFSRAKQIFAQFQLQHAPVVFTFPAPSDTNAVPDQINYEFNQHGFEAQGLADHLARTLNLPFKYKRPVNVKLVALTTTAIVTLAATVYFMAPYLSVFVKSSKPFWMLVCLATIIVFTSGHMWNSIRNAPYVAMNPTGKPEYFASGFQNQYGIETQIVAALYALLAFSFIALTALVPAQRDPTRQRAGVYVWSAIFLTTFSVLFVVFRMKNPSYPFRLFF
ncbi:hypothetical protein BCV70DRAFT_199525 [Testicularia cyperi]|uniref:OST3-oligosaccharyltransferase gamma subunit n=1 Tax=Testicularia cyperi TaxID=1882483 RepID=A0A317XUV4_9BASI|nr:hypothetical protein BCV70DRAFT_199525 [Testicularia cyperi]